MKKNISIFSMFLLLILSVNIGFAQNLATKKTIAKYEKDYIPEFQQSLAYRTGYPAFEKINVEIDFASFDDNTEELDLAVRQLNMLKAALIFLGKDDVGKVSIEKGIKKVIIRKTKTPAEKEISLKNTNLTLATNSFDLKTLIGTPEIQKYLEKNL